ncbi:MAG: MFS transporter [Porphyromonadaceae bacterium]|nr:MFS transporter [Porphyromonadaceae bacterium]
MMKKYSNSSSTQEPLQHRGSPNQLSGREKRSFYPWLVVGLLWIVALLNYMDRQMLSTMKDAMSIDIEELRSATSFGYLMAAFMWIYGLASPLAGLVADRLSRKWLIVGSLFVWSLVTLLMGFTHNFSTLYALRAIMGVSEALYMPAALALIADFHTGRSRSLAIGIHMTGLYVGQALGGFGASLSQMFTWHDTFFYFGLAGSVYAVLLAFLLREAPTREAEQTVQKDATSPLRSFLEIFRTPAFWVILLFFTATSLPGWATKNWLPTLFATNLDIEMTDAGPWATITITLASFVGVFLGGAMSDRWVRTQLKGRVYTSAIGLMLMAPALMLLGFGHSFVTVAGGAIIFGLGLGLFDTNNMPIVCQFFPGRLRSTVYGLMNMSGVLAGAYITQLLGKSMDGNNLGESFAYLAFGIIVVAIIQLVGLRPKTDNKQD